MTKYYACAIKTKGKRWKMALDLYRSKDQAQYTADMLLFCRNVKKVKVVKVKV